MKTTIKDIHALATDADLSELRFAARALSRWFEMECGLSLPTGGIKVIERDGNGVPYRVICRDNGIKTRVKIADDELKNRSRIEKICNRLGLHFFIQTDPRGLPLYLSTSPINRENYVNGFAIDL